MYHWSRSYTHWLKGPLTFCRLMVTLSHPLIGQNLVISVILLADACLVYFTCTDSGWVEPWSQPTDTFYDLNYSFHFIYWTPRA